ncbi:MAG: methionyl-tRNA formyltransferase [Acidobacteria bacterium]|nr:methionyl-tRNA formyltransferase [Acidobacteriota bacterium]
MRVMLFGTPQFAVPTLAALLETHDVAAVVTRSDRPRGRGQKVTPNPVKALATARGIPVLQPTRLDDPEWLAQIESLGADLAVVVAYGRLLPQRLLDIPRLGFINVHASLLPRWRGAAPIHRAVLAGDTQTGITIMRVVLALDAGPTFASATTPIDLTDTSEVLETRLASMGAELLVATIARMTTGAVTETPQDESGVTYAARLERRESQVDWTRPATQIDRQVRGLQPWPLAAVTLGGRRIAFLKSSVVDDASPGATAGVILEAGDNGLLIACGTGAVRVTEVLPEGRRAMPASAFLRGTKVQAGTMVVALPAREHTR